jgi:hypothetical protein
MITASKRVREVLRGQGAKMIYSKFTYGYVVQTYDSETGDCIEQQFVHDQRVERQDQEGQPIPDDQIEELANTEKECSFDMVQP